MAGTVGATPAIPPLRTNGIVRVVGNAAATRNSLSSINSSIGVGPPTLHRPFSPSPQPKDVS